MKIVAFVPPVPGQNCTVTQLILCITYVLLSMLIAHLRGLL